jgi:lipopolysaccharide/colanic/teichoic acid biosynthesis glycosyltransferase
VNPLLDRVLAALILAAATPLLAAAAGAIRLESPGPVLYRQRRVGRDGQPFELIKLRTMVSGAEWIGAGIVVDDGDPRITRVGTVLRRLSVDELPNLINVVRGEMALVGPRPTVQAQVDRYTERQRRRLEVRPGLTGWAQVHGRAALPWHERIELDVWYVDHRSLALDLRILAMTAGLLISGRGLYRGETGGWRPLTDRAGERPGGAGERDGERADDDPRARPECRCRRRRRRRGGGAPSAR